VELGTPLGQVIDVVGSGLGAGRSVKAVLPGVAAPFVTDMTVPVSYEGFERAGSAMGAGGYQVLDDTACMVGAALAASRFLAEESCGQCPPCKLGSTEITRLLERLEAGRGDARDVETLGKWVRRVSDGNRCYLAVQEQLVVGSAMTTFAEELTAHVTHGGCPSGRPTVLPRLADLHDGTATLAAS
jgi:NADH:ubiquinone oxidoreductase subunit F (NADH-binding)